MKKLSGAITAAVPTFAKNGGTPAPSKAVSTQVPLKRKKKKKIR
jgi:hypothetical protein